MHSTRTWDPPSSRNKGAHDRQATTREQTSRGGRNRGARGACPGGPEKLPAATDLQLTACTLLIRKQRTEPSPPTRTRPGAAARRPGWLKRSATGGSPVRRSAPPDHRQRKPVTGCATASTATTQVCSVACRRSATWWLCSGLPRPGHEDGAAVWKKSMPCLESGSLPSTAAGAPLRVDGLLELVGVGVQGVQGVEHGQPGVVHGPGGVVDGVGRVHLGPVGIGSGAWRRVGRRALSARVFSSSIFAETLDLSCVQLDLRPVGGFTPLLVGVVFRLVQVRSGLVDPRPPSAPAGPGTAPRSPQLWSRPRRNSESSLTFQDRSWRRSVDGARSTAQRQRT